jgi:hypothetical protein
LIKLANLLLINADLYELIRLVSQPLDELLDSLLVILWLYHNDIARPIFKIRSRKVKNEVPCVLEMVFACYALVFLYLGYIYRFSACAKRCRKIAQLRE